MLETLRHLLEVYEIDALIFIVVGYCVLDGFYRGFIHLGLELAGFILATSIGLLTYRLPANVLETRFGVPYLFAASLCFFVIWCMVDFVWSRASARIESRISSETTLSRWNRIFGVLPGIAAGTVLSASLAAALLALPMPTEWRASIATSSLTQPLVRVITLADNEVRMLIDPSSERGLNLVAAPALTPGEHPIRLHFTAVGTPDSAAEQMMLGLVNRERIRRGVPELQWSTELRDVARSHSDDMFRRGYFNHFDPDGKGPDDRARAAGISYGTVGENLALAPSASVAHGGLMDSPGHRANILNKDFHRFGIGVIDGGIYGKMFTQMFSD